MNESYDRRAFLRKGAEGLLTAAAVGAGGVALDACGSTKSGTGGSTATTLGPSGVTDHGPPVRGGSMNIGTWSEVNGLSPPTARWDATGYLYGNALFDTLVQIGADGKPHPYLAKSFSSNPDFTVWTFELREGVKFHNGELCDAKAVANCLEAVKTGLITGKSLTPVQKIEPVGSLTVRITVDVPWPAFPSYMAGQIGYIVAPAMLKSTNAGATNPIGTGPFTFVDWVPGNHLSVKRNPNYWQPGFPYLDSITFKPLLDNTERGDALRSGSIDMMHSQAPETIKTFFGNSSYQVVLSSKPPRGEPDVDFIMLNVQAEHLKDLEVRRALAMGLSKEEQVKTYGAGLTTSVNSPFIPGEIWYTDTSYPQYNPKEAAKLIAKYKARTGKTPTVELSTIQGPQYAQVVQLIQANWQAIGVTTKVVQQEFAAFLTNVVLGNYGACTFEQFGASDPDQNYIWWSTDTFAPIGQISLNIARNKDPRIQKQLNVGRQSTKLPDRIAAYKEVSKLLAEDLPYLWLGKTYWAAVATDKVVGIVGQKLPDGSMSSGFSNGACLVHELAKTK